jgi:hypothetical protein
MVPADVAVVQLADPGQRAVALPDERLVAGEGDVGVDPAKDDQVALPAREVEDRVAARARGTIAGLPEDERVRAGAALQLVAAAVAAEAVVATSAAKAVVAPRTGDLVVVRRAEDGVVAGRS